MPCLSQFNTIVSTRTTTTKTKAHLVSWASSVGGICSKFNVFYKVIPTYYTRHHKLGRQHCLNSNSSWNREPEEGATTNNSSAMAEVVVVGGMAECASISCKPRSVHDTQPLYDIVPQLYTLGLGGCFYYNH